MHIPTVNQLHGPDNEAAPENAVPSCVDYAHPVGDVKVLLAGQLVVRALNVAHDLLNRLVCDSVAGQHVLDVVLIPVTKWAS